MTTNTNMKRILIAIVIILSALAAKAETLKGSVVDSRGEAMPFVTISVLAKDSTLLTGAITDEEGKYIVTPPDLPSREEKYIIQASYVGYQTAFGGPDFVLREETERLKEGEVKAKTACWW